MIKGLPERLKELRQQYHLSQRAVAKKVYVSPASIAAYETGERTPSVESILAFARLYHCSTDFLLGNKQTDVSAVSGTEGLSDKQIKLLIELIDTMREQN